MSQAQLEAVEALRKGENLLKYSPRVCHHRSAQGSSIRYCKKKQAHFRRFHVSSDGQRLVCTNVAYGGKSSAMHVPVSGLVLSPEEGPDRYRDLDARRTHACPFVPPSHLRCER
jgi:hypothetical protein